MRPSATSVCGLKLLGCEAVSYQCVRPEATSLRVWLEQELDVGPLLSKTARPKRRNSLAVSSSSRMSCSAEDAKDDDTAGNTHAPLERMLTYVDVC